jgi:tetratricopeptide (TPR) repeat protein
MSIRRSATAPAYVTPSNLPDPAVEPAWLSGTVEVQVAGESFHLDAIRAAPWNAPPGGPLVAVLVPDLANPHDPCAVAVYVQGMLVGYLPAAVAARVQPALVEFGRERGGCWVSCPALIREHPEWPQVVLLLDPGPLQLTTEAVETMPEMARTLSRLLVRLDQPAPVFNSADVNARVSLCDAEQVYEHVDNIADWGERAAALPAAERAFGVAADKLRRSKDPLLATALLGLARSIRYQRGRRDDTLAAYVEAIYNERDNQAAWSELIEYVAAAPHIPTLVTMFSKAPLEVRPELLGYLLAISDGHDRAGRLGPAAGSRLRAALLELADSQGDTASVAALAADAGMRAYKEGDTAAAIGAWRRAIAAGSADPKVADRLSIWLMQHDGYAEATRVLHQALARPSDSPTALRERLTKRLARCQRDSLQA